MIIPNVKHLLEQGISKGIVGEKVKIQRKLSIVGILVQF